MSPNEPHFSCPACGRKFFWKAASAGQVGKCRCGHVVTVPTESPETGPIPLATENSVSSAAAPRPGASFGSPAMPPPLTSPVTFARFSPIARVGLLVWGAMFVLASPLSGYFLLRMFIEANASSNWPSVSGLVTRAAIVPEGAWSAKCSTEVRYEYTVGGQLFTGTRLRTSDGQWPDERSARRALGSITPGMRVNVYYAPSEPQQSVLQPGAGFQEYALLTIPIIMFGIGVGLLLLVIGDMRRPARPLGNRQAT